MLIKALRIQACRAALGALNGKPQLFLHFQQSENGNSCAENDAGMF